MKKLYEDSTLEISLDSFPTPKEVGIPIDCDLLLNPTTKLIG